MFYNISIIVVNIFCTKITNERNFYGSCSDDAECADDLGRLCDDCHTLQSVPPDDELSAEGGLSLAHPADAGASGCRVLRAQAHPGQDCLQWRHQGDGQLHRDRHVAAPDQSSHRVPGLVPLSEGVRQEGPADRHRRHDQGQAQ